MAFQTSKWKEQCLGITRWSIFSQIFCHLCITMIKDDPFSLPHLSGKVQVLVQLFDVFSLCGLLEQQSPGDGKFFFFLLINTRSGQDWVILLYLKVPENFRGLSRTDSGLCIFHLCVGANFTVLHNSAYHLFCPFMLTFVLC